MSFLVSEVSLKEQAVFPSSRSKQESKWMKELTLIRCRGNAYPILVE